MKDEQKDAITVFRNGKGVFVSLPMGSGKVYFALIPKLVDKLKKTLCLSSEQQSIFVIILPLVSLMDDQVACFFKRGISSASITSKEVPVRVRNALMLYPEFNGIVTHSANVKCFFTR